MAHDNGELLDQLFDWAKSEGLSPEINKSRSLMVVVPLKNESLRLAVMAIDPNVIFYAAPWMSIEEARVHSVMELTNLMNDSVPFASFEYSEPNKWIAVRTHLFGNASESVSRDALNAALAALVSALQTYSSLIRAVADGLLTPTEAMDRLRTRSEVEPDAESSSPR